MSDPERKLEVDDGWKRQAEAEKQKLAGSPAETPPQRGPAGTQAQPAAAPASRPAAGATRPAPRLPPASFELMVEQYVTQVLLALGAVAHPTTGKRTRDMDLAKHYIDLLAVLEAKTKGNLTPDEDRLLSTALYEARMTYVNASRSR